MKFLFEASIFHRPRRRLSTGVLALLLLLLGYRGEGQVQQAWVAKYNNGITNGNHQALKMALDSEGNIYITGFSQDASSNLDYATLKCAPNGTQLWAARYHSTSNLSSTPAAICVDSNGNAVITGSAVTVKYDALGNQLWTAPYAGSALGIDSGGNAFVTGFSTDLGIVKLAPSGTNIWVTNYASPWGATTCQSLAVDAAGDVYVSGSQSIGCLSEGPYIYCYVRAFAVEYNASGGQLWDTAYDPYSSSFSLSVRASAVDGSGGLYVLVDFDFNPYYLVRFSANGTMLWLIESSTADNSTSHGLAVNSAGEPIITGENAYFTPTPPSYGTYMYETNGASVWSENYISPVGTSAGLAIAVDNAGSAYVTGFSPGVTTSNDIVTIKYDSAGNQIWLQRYNGPANGDDEGNAIAVDKNGNVYVAGYETVVGGGTEMVLIKYSPVTLQQQTNGGFVLQAQGAPGQIFDFQASTNLQT